MAGVSPDPSPDSSFQALWDENYDLIRSYLKRLSYLRPDHISAKKNFLTRLSRAFIKISCDECTDLMVETGRCGCTNWSGVLPATRYEVS